jgi:hypothetical protein
MSSNGDADLERALTLSMVTYNREKQQNGNINDPESSFEHLFESVFSELKYATQHYLLYIIFVYPIIKR